MDESACYLNWTLNFLEWSFEDLEGSSSLDLVFAGTRGFGIVRSKEVVVWGKQINTRSDTINEKIKKLDVEFSKRREQIKKARPGPTQEAIKARAMRILKHKKNVWSPGDPQAHGKAVARWQRSGWAGHLPHTEGPHDAEAACGVKESLRRPCQVSGDLEES
ncbi:uncharacterized protein [Physcomitrium patens]|uniref:uncharacterized protein n=1 Tax=Physcomitrium patens TaxID=3218 RepID=UPI003CCD1B59